jgi:hypothetical protein
MLPNVNVAESIGHRARFVWLGLALAATIALLVIPTFVRGAPRASRSEPALLDRSMYRVHRCHESRRAHAQREAERAERRARLAAERARFAVERAMERAEHADRRAAERAIERAERVERRLRRHHSYE